MSGEWEALIRRYADGRPICNCGRAYYATDGEYTRYPAMTTHHDGYYCKHGCHANQYSVKDDIAARVLADLGATR